jgi:hypothetical protein
MPNAHIAAYDPEAAFDRLRRESSSKESSYKNITEGLAEMFDGQSLATATGDPDSASVIIGVEAEFIYAGLYGGTVSAYDCYVLLTAYDALTHEIITELSVLAKNGDTISVTLGSTTAWKYFPDPTTASDEDKAKFIKDLNDFWGK